MNEMVERVARAICLQAELDDGYADNTVLRGSIEMGMWRNYVNPARAAIAAMRDPDETMLKAVRDWSYKKYGKPIGNDAAVGCWQAMIDAALK